jgi:hypothetical protein
VVVQGGCWSGAGGRVAFGWSNMVHVADSENPANSVYYRMLAVGGVGAWVFVLRSSWALTRAASGFGRQRMAIRPLPNPPSNPRIIVGDAVAWPGSRRRRVRGCPSIFDETDPKLLLKNSLSLPDTQPSDCISCYLHGSEFIAATKLRRRSSLPHHFAKRATANLLVTRHAPAEPCSRVASAALAASFKRRSRKSTSIDRASASVSP